MVNGSAPEFAFFHAFADVVMNERALRVEQVELMIETCPRLYESIAMCMQRSTFHLNLPAMAVVLAII